MAAELIGTVYVRIKPLTQNLGRDISDSFDKGMKDAQADIDKSAERSGEDAGRAHSRGIAKGMQDGKSDVLGAQTDLIDSPEINKRNQESSERRGRESSRSFRDGVDKESKRRNPFAPFGDALRKFPIGKLLIGTLAVPAVGGALKLLGGYLVGLTAWLGTVAQAAAGAGAALGGLVALIPGLGVALAAFKVESEALNQFKEALTPIGDAWKEVGFAAQEYLLPGVAMFLGQITELMPMVRDFARALGGQLQDNLLTLGDVLTSDKNKAAFSSILDESLLQFDALGRIVIRLGDLLPSLFAGMAPIATDFLNVIDDLVASFQTFVNTKGVDGLTATFEKWWDRAKLVGGALADLTIGLWNVLSIGADITSESGALGGFREMAATFREWSVGPENVDKIRTAFQNGLEIFRAVNGLFGDIIKMIGAPIVSGNTEGVLGFIQSVREDWLPSLQELSAALAGTGTSEALQGLMDALISFITEVGTSGSLAAFIDTLAVALGSLATVLSTPGVAQAAAILLPLAGSLRAMAALRLDKLAGLLWSLGGALGGLALGPVAAAAAVIAAIAGAFYLAYRYIEPFREAVDRFIDVFQEFEWSEAWDNLLNGDWAALGEQFSGLGEGLREAFGDIDWGKIGEGLDKGIRDGFRKVVDWISNSFIPTLGSFWSKVPTMMGDALRNAGPLIGAALGYVIGFIIRELPPKIVQLGWAIIQELPGIALAIVASLDDIFLGIIGAFAGFFVGLFAGLDLLGAVQGVLDFFGNLPSMIMEGVSGLIMLLADFFTGLWEAIVGAVEGFSSAITSWFGELPGRIWAIVVGYVGIVTAIGQWFINTILAGIVGIAQNIWSWFTSLPGEIWGLVTGAGQMIWNLGEWIIGRIVAGVKAVASDIWDWFTDLPGEIVDFVKGAFSKLYNLGRDIVDEIVKGIGSMGSAIADKLKSLVPSPGDIVGGIVGGIGGIVGLSLPVGPGSGAIPVPTTARTFGNFASPVPHTFGGLTRSPVNPVAAAYAGMNPAHLTVNVPNVKTGETTMVKIDNATFNEPTDIDMLVAKIRFSYNTMGGS